MALQAAGFGVRLLAEEHSFLQIDAINLGKECGDQTLNLLAPAKTQIAWLNLARTGIGDQGMGAIGALENLTHLNLSLTGVGDAGLAELGRLTHLESLNLVGTPVSDEGLQHLHGLTALRRLYLWQSQTSAKAGMRSVVSFPECR